MYLTYIMYKAESDREDNINEAIETTFNALAYVMEDEDGNVKSEYKALEYAYKLIRDTCFVVNDTPSLRMSGEESLENAPQKYSLKVSVRCDSLLFKTMKKLSAKLFALSMKDVFGKAGVDEDILERLCNSKNSEGMSFMLANLYFGNDCQSKGVQSFSLENEYFKQLTTFLGNAGRYRTDHEYINQLAWLRAGDSMYDDYTVANAAQSAGYRRVFIKTASGVDVTGKVVTGSGKTVATFKNDQLLSRSSQWIGITTCDTGSWLRLPVNIDYKVVFSVSKDSSISLKVGDYSIEEGKVVRNVKNDNNYNWTSKAVKSTDTLTLNIPAAETDGDSYDITSAYYSLGVKSNDPTPSIKVVVDKNQPKIKNLKVKAGTKSVTATWNKLTTKQLKKVEKIEIQYSTNKKFTSASTVRKEISKSKKSYKISKLKKGTRYYVRMRTVKYSYDQKVVSKWTVIKSAKAK
jgi:hypothetical protein